MRKLFNKEIDQLLLSVNFVERKFQKYYFILDNIQDEKQNYILYRNLYYFDLIMDKIKANFTEINVMKKIIKNKKLKKEVKKKLKDNMKSKAFASTILLKELVKMINTYALDKWDFEVQSIIHDERSLLMTGVPQKYKDVVLEEYAQIDFDYNYFLENFQNFQDLEHFGLFKKIGRAFRKVGRGIARGVTRVGKSIVKGVSSAVNAIKRAYNKVKNFASNMIKSIGNFFRKMFSSIKKILSFFKSMAKFLFKNLLNFIKLMWKLIIGLFNFIVKWVPRFVKRFFTFWRYLFIKAKKTGLVTVGLYGLINIGMTKYWDLLLGDIEAKGHSAATFVPQQLVLYPALFFTAHIFWTQTRALAKVQKSIFRFFAKNLKVIKFFLITVLGLPPTNLFTARMSTSRRLILLGRYFKNNLPKFILRFCIFLFIFKKLILDSGVKDILGEGVISFSDLLIFPLVIVRFLLQLIF